MSLKSVFSVCGMCPTRCPIEVEIENEECRFIHGNRYFPGIKGALCTRGAGGIPFIRDNERPQFPLVRTGERGSGRWRRLSWEDAFKIAAGKIQTVRKEFGGKSVCWLDTGGIYSDLRQAFVRGLNSPNFYTEDSIEGVNRQHAALSLFGFTEDRLVLDLTNARETVLQGRNLFESIHIEQANHLMDNLGKGGRLTVIDIRATVTSGKADRFLMIRPGTDYIFNLSVIHILLSRKWYHKAFSDTWIQGIDILERFVSAYTPEQAEKETGIKAEAIVRFTEDLAKAAPSVVWHPGWHSGKYKDSYFVNRSALIINALLGAIGAKGGLPIATAPEDIGQKGLKRFTDLFQKVKEPKADGEESGAFSLGPGRFQKALLTIETMQPYDVKGLITYQQDPLLDLPDPLKMKSLLEKLDFSIAITSTWTETAWMSDLILPLSPYLEREGLIGQVDGVEPTFLLRKRCVSPRYETLSDWEIVAGLSKGVGIQSLVFNSVDDIWKYQLSGTTVRIQDFNKTGFVRLVSQPQYDRIKNNYRFPTPSGRIEVTGGPGDLSKGLGAYQNRPKPASGMFRLTVGGSGFHHAGYTINNPLLNKQMPENVLWMNTVAGGQIGIEDGDMVVVSAKDRSGRIKVKLTEHIHPEAVFMVPGFGRTVPFESRAFGKGLSVSMLMPDGLDISDTVTGGLALQEHMVQIRKN